MSGSAAKQSSDERTMIRDGGAPLADGAFCQTDLRQQMRDAPVHVHILGHRKHRRFGMMRDKQLQEFFYSVCPKPDRGARGPAGRGRECRRRPDGPSPAPGVAARSSHLIADRSQRRQRARSQVGKSQHDGPEAGRAPPHGARDQTVRKARLAKGRGASSPPKAPNVG